MRTITTIFICMIMSVSLLTSYASGAPEGSKQEVEQLLRDRGILSHQPFKGLHISSASSQKDNVFIHRGDFAVSEVLTKFWNGSGWANEMLETFIYDAEGGLTGRIAQIWEDGQWVNNVSESYTYDEMGEPMILLYKQWDPEIDEWVDFGKVTFMYDPVTWLLDEVLVEINLGESWMNAFYYEYEYNAQNLVAAITYFEWDFIANDWVNNDLETYFYDSGNYLVEMLEQLWDLGEWINDRHFNYTNNAEGMNTSTLEKVWDINTGTWQDNYRYTYTYNASDLMTNELTESWTGSWQNSRQVTYEFDGNNNLVTELVQVWLAKNGNREWFDQYLLTYSYNLVGISENSPGLAMTGKMAIYPNPVTSTANIMIKTGDAGKGFLTVTDNRGVKVYEQGINIHTAGNHIIEWNVDDRISTGLYIARFELNGNIFESKILIDK